MTDDEQITLLLDHLDKAREAIANAQQWADKWKAYAFAMKAERDELQARLTTCGSTSNRVGR
jgi:hypothetical protein